MKPGRLIGMTDNILLQEKKIPARFIEEPIPVPWRSPKAPKMRDGKEQNPKSEKVGEAELLLSSTDNWGAAFINNYFLIGPADLVRRCLSTPSTNASLSTTEQFRKSQSHVDVSLPMTALTFTKDERAAISFIETFANQQRSAFATTGSEIDQAAKGLPMALSATVLGDSSIEWSARSSFGLGGSLAAQLFPQDYK